MSASATLNELLQVVNRLAVTVAVEHQAVDEVQVREYISRVNAAAAVVGSHHPLPAFLLGFFYKFIERTELALAQFEVIP